MGSIYQRSRFRFWALILQEDLWFCSSWLQMVVLRCEHLVLMLRCSGVSEGCEVKSGGRADMA